MPHRSTGLTALASLSFILLAATVSLSSGFQPQSSPVPLTPQDLKQEDTDRERYQKATEVLKALEISRGDWVAAVGAGNGYYVQRMADLVGPAGKVWQKI